MPVEVSAEGAWKVNAGRPGMRDGTDSTTLAVEGTDAPVVVVKIALMVVAGVAVRESEPPTS